MPDWVTVCDREAPIDEFLDAVLKQGGNFMVGARQGRSFTEGREELFRQVSQQAVQDLYSLSLKRRPDRPARTAQVELRLGTVSLQRPQRADSERAPLTLQVIAVFEPNPPAGEEGIHWLVLTSLPLETGEPAHQSIIWYT